jgi:putative ABC transport system permease protein
VVTRLHSLTSRIFTFLTRDRQDRQINEEFEAHLLLLTERFVSRGMTPQEAALAARRQFGGITQMKQECYEASGLPRLETFLKDALYALRNLCTRPGFTITAVLVLGIGVGANTAMFTIVRAVVLKPLGYKEPNALVLLSMENSRNLATFTPIRYRQLKALSRSFSDLGAYGLPENMMFTARSGSGSEQLTAARVSANTLRLLGVRPLLGRGFLDEEDRPGGTPVALISAELWRTHFGSDSSVIGRNAVLDTQSYTVIGVMPAGFEFPFSGIDVWLTRPAEWTQIAAQNWDRTASLTGFARLKPGVSVQQALAELAVLNQQYVASNAALPDAKAGATVHVERLADALVGPVRTMLWILFGTVAFVLLIACANLASLMLARATFRKREFAIRAALGAGRARLMIQSLMESILLSLAGAALGVGLASMILTGIRHQSAFALPRASEIQLDGVVFVFALIIAVVAGALAGAIPLIRVGQQGLVQALREHGATVNPSRRIWSGLTSRGLLVVAQVGLSIVLLIGAGLLIKSFARLRNVDLGFHSANVLTMRITLPPARYGSGRKIAAFFDDLVQRVQAIPGIRYAAVVRSLPTLPYQLVALQVAEQPPITFTERPLGALQTVSGSYFQLMGIVLRAGREFTDQDFKRPRPILIVNEALARRFWPGYTRGQEPVGQHLQLGNSTFPVEIVGVVSDIHEGGPGNSVVPEVYLPYQLSPPQTAYLLVRGDNDPLGLLNETRAQISAMDREQAVSAVKTLNELVDSAIGQQRLTTLLLGAFAGVALLLAAVGLYGVIAYAVAQRAAEIGIRRALGAQTKDVLLLIIGQGLRLTIAGVLLGVGGALALTPLMHKLLFEVKEADPGTFVAIIVLLVVVALIASYLPARRATRIDPVKVLR